MANFLGVGATPQKFNKLRQDFRWRASKKTTHEVIGIAAREDVLTMEILKVSAKSNPNSVAGALAGVLREHGTAEMQAIGAGALNQAVKAVAIARGFVAPHGVDLICIPAFTDIKIEGEDRTAIKLIVEPR